MKILNINSYYFSSTVHNHLQMSLIENGVDSYTYVPIPVGYIPRKECVYKKENKNLKKVECYKKTDRYIFHIKHRKILKNIIKEYNFCSYSCLHAHSLFSNGYIAMKIKRKYGIPYIVTVRSTDINTFFKKMFHLRSLGYEILFEADCIVFISPKYKDYLIEKFIKRIHQATIFKKSFVIPNGIDKFWLENKFSPKRLKSKNKIYLLYVGEISKRKNITKTINAINILIGKGYNIFFTIVGNIVDEKLYKNIRKYKFINYISPKPKEKLIEIYRENDIFVMPSITETFGLVYAEAMSQGLPVIYTKGQGFDGQFPDGVVGFSVDCYDPKDIASKLINIIEKYEEISQNCVKLCDTFSWDRISKEYIELYRNMSNLEKYKNESNDRI